MTFGNVNTRLKRLKERLQLIEGQNLLHDTANEIQALKKEINETLVKEEVMWNQRSRALWLKCGDRNTRFFHTTATQRRRRNRIEGLMDEGVWYDSKEHLERVILKYFSSIYCTDHPTSFDANLNAVAPRVTQVMNGELLGTFKEEEIKAALNQMHPTKAPSPMVCCLFSFRILGCSGSICCELCFPNP